MKIFNNKYYKFSISELGFNLFLNQGNKYKLFLKSQVPFILYPEISGCSFIPDSWQLIETNNFGILSWLVHAKMTGSVQINLQNHFYFLDNRLICNANYSADKPHNLQGWSIVPKGSKLNCERIHTLSGQHGSDNHENGTWHSPEIFNFSTASHNWTYVPVAPRILFYNGKISILVGGTKISGDYGMEINLKEAEVESWRFNYGGMEDPLKINAKENIAGPRLQMQFGNNLIPEHAHKNFNKSLINDGLVIEKHYTPEENMWRRPWYCTWGDQMGIAGSALTQDQGGQPDYSVIKNVLTQNFVEKAADFIRKNKLNIGTIIIDDGWQDKRGDWNLMKEKFPDMRKLIDYLHELGFLVVIWWAPFLTEPTAEVLKRKGFTAGPTKKHKEMIINYSNPEVREWIEEKLELWFGSGPECWNIDGLKLDFLLEKIYPESQKGDISWRGEENAYYHLLKMITSISRRYKPSSGILHAPYNPMFAQFCTAVHTEERFDKNLRYFSNRFKLADIMLPGVWVAPHFNYNPVSVPEAIRRVKKSGGIVQIGRLLSPDVTPEIINEIRTLLLP
jgi:hypothetical protein